MPSKSSIFFKVLINRYHPGMGESFLKSMPKENSKEILSQNVESADAIPLLSLAQEQIDTTHYSWLTPVIQQMPIPLQTSVIASLAPHQSLRLSEALNLPSENLNLAEPIKRYFINKLWNQWKPTADLPVQYLPASSLSVLMELNKNELVELIDFLALYDLTEAIRHIVDKNFLKKLYQAISPKKQQFLRICLHQKERITSPKLELEKWSGDPQKLESILHRRGLFRLGKALSGQHSDFLWYIVHKLDIGRGSILTKYFSPEEIQGITPLLVQQVIFLINFLKKKGET